MIDNLELSEDSRKSLRDNQKRWFLIKTQIYIYS